MPINTPPGFVPEGAPSGFLQAPEGEMAFKNPTAWQRGRMATSGALEKAGVPAGGAKNLAEFAIPGSNTEAGIQGALALLPIVGPAASKMLPALAKEAPMLFNILQRSGRVALPTAGGAVGAMTEGRPASSGATKGAAVGAFGEAVPLALEWGGRAASTGPMERRMAQSLGKTIGDSATTLPKMNSADDIVRTVVTDKGMTAIGAAHDAALNDISEKLSARTVTGGRSVLPTKSGIDQGMPLPGAYPGERGKRFWTVDVPGHAGPQVPRPAGHDVIEVPALREVAGKADFNFREAVGWLKTLADEGWLISQREKSGIDAVAARKLRAQAREQIVQALDQHVPGLGADFNKTQGLYDKGRLYIDLFRQPGVVKEGRPDYNALRDALGKTDKSGTHTWGQAIERATRGNPEEAEAFFRALFRGGEFTGRDTPGGIGAHLGFSAGAPHLGFTRPGLPRWAGDPAQLPWYARPGSLNQLSMPAAFSALGLTREPEGR